MFSIKDIESGIIFEKCTIQEISDVERKLRQDIEKKKEDLRQMVGERYRELIEAADTITDMKNGTEKVASSIKNLQELCQSLKQSSIDFHKLSLCNASKAPSSLPRNQLNKFNQAVCMKLLMDIPNKIWSSLDREEYLNATRLYLLAHHLHTCLRSGLGECTSKLINIIIRQWTTVSHLHTTITKGVEAKLMDAKLSEKLTADCLCSIVLLREISVEEVFLQFLRSREELVKQNLDSCGLDATVKPLLCDVTGVIVATLRQVEDIFAEKKEGGGLLISKLQHVLACNNSDFFGQHGFSLSEAAVKYLPPHVLDFKPNLKVPLKAIDKSFMIKHCSEFVDRSSDHVHRGAENLLNFVTTFKALSDIRDAIYQLLKENLGTCNWQSLCTEVMGRELNIWDQLLREHFLDRLKVMLEDQMDSLLSSTKVNVSKTLEDFADLNKKMLVPERNLSSYVWSEGAGDVPQNAVWTPVNQKAGSRDGGLHMKAKGHTPGVQSLCQSIDKRVKILFDDVTSYTNPPLFQNTEPFGLRPSGHDPSPTSSGFLPSVLSLWRETSPASARPSSTLEDSFADRIRVRDLLRTTCTSFLNNLLEFFKMQLHAYQEVNVVETTDISIIVQRALYLGRVGSGICDLSPSLRRCVIQDDEQAVEISTPNAKTWKNLKQTSSQTSENRNWLEVLEKLETFSREVHVLWSDYVNDSLLTEFKSNLLHRSNNTYSAFVSSCTQWDSTIIEEENEDGAVVKSAIKVPMQASWFVQDLLYKLCLHINKIGGHVMSSSTVNNLAKKLLTNILTVYDDLLSSSSLSIHQSRALQMWFDVKYLTGVLSSNKDDVRVAEVEKLSLDVLDRLESHVDPFDLDVFRPHMKKHLDRLLQRSSILYGLVLTSDRSSSFSSSLPSTSGQEQHHVVPLSTGLNRFPLLPLSQQPNKLNVDASTSKLSQKTLESMGSGGKTFNTASSALPPQSSAAQKEQSPAPPPRAGSSSFLEQMSTLFSSSSATTLYIK